MDQRIIDFLTKERICSLTTIIDGGQPHSATMHYSYTVTPSLKLYFSTNKTSRKILNSNSFKKASFLIGFSETEWTTLQIEGDLEIVGDEELSEVKTNHYDRNPSSKKFEGDPNTIFLCFKPTWWRYTDYKTSPVTILSSES